MWEGHLEKTHLQWHSAEQIGGINMHNLAREILRLPQGRKEETDDIWISNETRGSLVLFVCLHFLHSLFWVCMSAASTLLLLSALEHCLSPVQSNPSLTIDLNSEFDQLIGSFFPNTDWATALFLYAQWKVKAIVMQYLSKRFLATQIHRFHCILNGDRIWTVSESKAALPSPFGSSPWWQDCVLPVNDCMHTHTRPDMWFILHVK